MPLNTGHVDLAQQSLISAIWRPALGVQRPLTGCGGPTSPVAESHRDHAVSESISTTSGCGKGRGKRRLSTIFEGRTGVGARAPANLAAASLHFVRFSINLNCLSIIRETSVIRPPHRHSPHRALPGNSIVGGGRWRQVAICQSGHDGTGVQGVRHPPWWQIVRYQSAGSPRGINLFRYLLYSSLDASPHGAASCPSARASQGFLSPGALPWSAMSRICWSRSWADTGAWSEAGGAAASSWCTVQGARNTKTVTAHCTAM